MITRRLVLVLVLTCLWMAGPIIASLVVAFSQPGLDSAVGRFGSVQGFRDIAKLGYLPVILPTLVVACLGSFIAVWCAFVTAAATRLAGSRMRHLLLYGMSIPMLISIVPRAYAILRVVTGPSGAMEQWWLRSPVVPEAVRGIAIVDGLRVTTGLAYTYLPYVFFVCWAALQEIRQGHLYAARDLGTRETRLVRELLWPSVRSLVIGTWVVVTVLMALDFVAPSLFGSGKYLYVGTAVEHTFFESRNVPATMALCLVAGSVAATVGLLAAGVLAFSQKRLAEVQRRRNGDGAYLR